MVNSFKKTLITQMDVREYFQERVSKAVVNQSVDVTDDTVFYVVNLLTAFADSKNLYDKTSNGLVLKPLASLYAEAIEIDSQIDKNRALRRLGDIALFIAGLFSDSLNRQPVDVDYYIAMGGNAYGSLSELLKGRDTVKVYVEIFDELSNRFTDIVDVLGEVGEESNLSTHSDLLRLYDIWVKTNSKRAARQLQKFGIYPAKQQGSNRQH